MRCVAERLPDVALERLHPVGDEALAVDLEQEMRAAAQVEAEHDLPLRQPRRPGGDRLGGEEVRDGQAMMPATHDEQDERDLPAREIEHRLSFEPWLQA